MTKKLQMCTKKSLSMFGQGFLVVSTDEKFFSTADFVKTQIALIVT